MKRILVVDDERLTADTLGIIFRQQGFETKVCYSVDDALVHAVAFAPALILCDITMPGRNGLELLVELTKQSFLGAVLVLTGYFTNLKPAADQLQKMPQRSHLLSKPCRPEDLLREANKILAVS